MDFDVNSWIAGMGRIGSDGNGFPQGFPRVINSFSTGLSTLLFAFIPRWKKAKRSLFRMGWCDDAFLLLFFVCYLFFLLPPEEEIG